MRKIYFLFIALMLPFLCPAQVIPNADMEGWRVSKAGAHDSISIDVPTDWYGSDSIVIALGQAFGFAIGAGDSDWHRQIFRESSIVHVGYFSAKIITLYQASYLIPGVISNAMPNISMTLTPPGITGVTLTGGTPTSVKPTSVSAWVRYYPGRNSLGVPGADSALLTVEALGQLGGKDSVIGTGTITIPARSTWTEITANVTYTDTATPVDTFRVAFSSSKSGLTGMDSSTLYVDDLSMAVANNPVNHTFVNNIRETDEVKLYPNPSAGSIVFESSGTRDMTCELYTAGGQSVLSRNFSGIQSIDVSSLPDGIYFYLLKDTQSGIIQRGRFVLIK